MTRAFALLALLILACPASAQPGPPLPAFLQADIHPAPRRSYPFFFAVLLPENRYVVRDATMLDLIAHAWNVDPENVQGGPRWLELDRFDLFAKVPTGTSKDDQRLMLRALLTDRFHLTLHQAEKPMPAYVLTLTKGKPKLTPPDGLGDPVCDDRGAPQQSAPPAYIFVSCRNMTMDDFARQLHEMAGGYLKQPVVNGTHLEGSWNLNLKWTGRGDLERQGADGISIFDAVDKQLGLKLTLETAPRLVLLVEDVARQPSPGLSATDKLLSSPPLPQFEVATIKPSKPGEHGSGRITGEAVNMTNATLKDLIDLAWDLNENDHDNIVGAPPWLGERRFDLNAKVSPESAGHPISGGLPMDIYEVEEMLRALLVERFAIKAHMEDRPVEAYTLVAASPKLKPADPSVRIACKEGPGPDGKDPRITNPILNRLVSCRNMSMAEIADELQRIAGGYIFHPVLDSTGIRGSWDFTLSFSSADRMPQNVTAPPPSGDAAVIPTGALSIFDAVTRQLGLKLEKHKRNLPVLVLEHIEEKPVAN